MTAAAQPRRDTYITALAASDMFNDDSYQRELDKARVRKIAREWDPRLVGVLEVSDRGEGASPRYAVVDSGHRWAAAQSLDIAPPLVATVHTGLSRHDEAALFARLNRERRRLTTWDHWRARLAAGDLKVTAIEEAVDKAGLTIDNAPRNGQVRCTATLEKLHALGGTRLIAETLCLVRDAWGFEQAGYDAPIVGGLGLVLHYLREPLDLERLHLALLDVMPRQVKTHALALRDITTGSHSKLVAMAVMALYNRRPGRKIPVSTRTFGPTAINTRSSITSQTTQTA